MNCATKISQAKPETPRAEERLKL